VNHVYNSKARRYAEDYRTESQNQIVCKGKFEVEVSNKNCARGTVQLKQLS